MNTVSEHENYEQDSAPQAPPEPDPARMIPPTYPAETRRKKGFPYKSPLLACLLSMFPGLGQVYIGYYQRGFVHIFIVATAILILNSNAAAIAPMIGTLLAFFWIYNIIDAGRRATLYNQAIDGIAGIEMPKDMKLTEGGSMIGGALLIAFGVIILLNTRFDISMAWLEDWWPVGIVGLGVYLIYKARKNGQKEIN